MLAPKRRSPMSYRFYCNFYRKHITSTLSAPSKSDIRDAVMPSSSAACPFLWSDRYAPSTLTNMLLDSPDIESLVSWLSSWDSDSKVSDSSDSSASTRSWRSTAFLVLGPSGCGKTALVYALAAKRAFKVFEVNTSSCRSRKDVLSQCSALIGSQQVSKESLSTSFSSFEMAKEHLQKAEERRRSHPKSSRRSIANFFKPLARKSSSASSTVSGRADSRKCAAPIPSNEGLTLTNKSLVLFDEVDVLFESDRGFWSAVGSLLRVGRRPILMTASDPSVVNTIPIPFRICNLRPLKMTAVEAFLRQICDREKCLISPVLPDLLSNLHSGSSEAILKKSDSQTLDARLLASTDYFYDIRRALNETHFYASSSAFSSTVDYVHSTNDRDIDLLNSFIERFPCLMSLTVPSVRSSPQETNLLPKVSSQADVFEGIFDSDADFAESPKRSSTERRANRSSEETIEKALPVDFVHLPVKQCRQLASDCLACLASAYDMQSLIDVSHASSLRRQHSTAAKIADELFQRSQILSREVQTSGLSTAAFASVSPLSAGPYATTSTSFASRLSCLGDSCETLTGVNPIGEGSAFRGERTWRGLTSLVLGKKMEYLNSVQLPVQPPSSPLPNLSGYYKGGCVQPDLKCAKTTASQSLSSMDLMRRNPNVTWALGLRETSQDYLSSLRAIARLESDRRSFSAQRRFFHYFDKIGLPEELCANLST
ncbi:hypothetical protein AAHC03_04592 [Spirometra sp. Aus1]